MNKKDIDKAIDKKLHPHKKVLITCIILVLIALILKLFLYYAYSPYNNIKLDYIVSNIEYKESNNLIEIKGLLIDNITKSYEVVYESDNSITYSKEDNLITIEYQTGLFNDYYNIVTESEHSSFYKTNNINNSYDLFKYLTQKESIKNNYFMTNNKLIENTILQEFSYDFKDYDEVCLFNNISAYYTKEKDEYKINYFLKDKKYVITLKGEFTLEEVTSLVSSIKESDKIEE